MLYNVFIYKAGPHQPLVALLYPALTKTLEYGISVLEKL
jgi:hypothetical protein